MKNVKTIQRLRIVIAMLGIVFTAGYSACSVNIFSGPICVCKCFCDSSAAHVCGSTDTTHIAGSTVCESDCEAKGTREDMCHDRSNHVIGQPNPPPPLCPSNETYVTYAFCDSCTSEQINGSGCTESLALQAAVMRFPESNPDCMLALCMGS